MDVELREAERLFEQSPTKSNARRLDKARRRAGYVERYVPCKRCSPESRCIKSHGRAMLCDVCGGDGWTHTELVPPGS